MFLNKNEENRFDSHKLKVAFCPREDLARTNNVYISTLYLKDFGNNRCYVKINSEVPGIFLAEGLHGVAEGNICLNKIHRTYNQAVKGNTYNCDFFRVGKFDSMGLSSCSFQLRFMNEPLSITNLNEQSLQGIICSSMMDQFITKGQEYGFPLRISGQVKILIGKVIEIERSVYGSVVGGYYQSGKFLKTTQIFLKISSGSKLRLFEGQKKEYIPSSDENPERFSAALEYSDFEVELENKTLKLWKPIFCSSNIDLECSFKINRSLDVEEYTLLRILMRKRVGSNELNFSNFTDYFFLFRTLGLTQGMEYIITWFKKMDRIFSKKMEIKNLFKVFRTCCIEYENENIKKWFREEEVNQIGFNIIKFDSSICHTLFKHMKNRYEEFRNFKKDNSLLIERKEFKNILRVLRTSDVELAIHQEISSSFQVEPLFVQLYKQLEEQSSSSFSDLILKSSDGVFFPCHKVVVILKSNFFSKMIKFGGKETQEMSSSNTIQLTDLNSNELSLILRYFYLSDINIDNNNENNQLLIIEKRLDVLISCLIFSDKFFERGLKKEIIELNSTRKISKKQKQDLTEIESSIRKYGHLLFGNDDLINAIFHSKMINVSTGCFGMNIQNFKSWVFESYNENRYSKLVEENFNLKNEIKEMKNTYEERFKKIELQIQNMIQKK